MKVVMRSELRDVADQETCHVEVGQSEVASMYYVTEVAKAAWSLQFKR